MKSKVFLMVIVISIAFAACQKDSMMDNSLGVDVKKYENELSQDYSYALEYHNALVTKSTNTVLKDSAYNKMMFHSNDSLFSEHFYQFCKDMMQNSGMMGSSTGMMGKNSGMMGNSGGMMNGSSMGGETDMNRMMGYMDSLNHASRNMMTRDFVKTDSLMHNQMTMCKMMVSQTDDIEGTYGKMQTLRKNHRLAH